jgi:adenylate cyclase
MRVDAYMVAAGVPIRRDDHASAIADLAIPMLDFVHALARERGEAIDLRIGIHSGPLVAGVIGKRKFS